ncbi:hypothetical protein [Sphingobacterium faecium]|uniref:hypothetical protein n=1 Tax=Sphingobacterium faecium TaxID=34087 RepID=UPI0024783FED|nr:hypothetical protein [Sphingobacterium faecium]WGQ15576.1 hypothetical protein QG727_04010 [Sphingobacterium faecium]
MKFHRVVVKELTKVGKEFVRLAWSKTANEGGFNDVSGDLRSSIAYAIVHRGYIMNSGYSPTGTSEGKKQARRLIAEKKLLYTDGYALVVVAGMDYATKVESKGRDVISGSSLIIEEMLMLTINRLKNAN